MSWVPNAANVALVTGIIAAAFISEDGATITAATLAASSLLDARLAFLSVFSGLWVGDLGVYAIARYLRPAASYSSKSNLRRYPGLGKRAAKIPAS